MAVKLFQSKFVYRLIFLLALSLPAVKGERAAAAGVDEGTCCTGPILEAPSQVAQSADEDLDSVSPGDLNGTNWRLVAFASDEPVPSEVEITAVFEAAQVSGSAGCNRYFAGLEPNANDGPAFSPIGTTRMACSEPLMEAEARYLSLLQRVERFGMQAGNLVLVYPEVDAQGALVFQRAE